MRVLLIRHAASTDGEVLNADGIEDARVLAAHLSCLQVAPNVILTSGSGDARHTGEALREELRLDGVSVHDLDALTASGTDWCDRVLDALEPVEPEATVAIVGNEPRLSLVLAHSTSTRRRPLARAEAVSLHGNDVQQFRRGRASVEFRTGLRGEPEDVLRDKLHSKAAVTTLLAGFTFAGLVELVTGGPLSGVESAAAILFTLSLGLLVACVYVYDQLALPAGFWSAAARSVGTESGLRARVLRRAESSGHELRMWTSRRADTRRSGFVFHHALRNHGVVYAYMVWTWMWIFTPAVLAGLTGFILLLVATEQPSIMVGGIGALALAVALYIALRPRVGTD